MITLIGFMWLAVIVGAVWYATSSATSSSPRVDYTFPSGTGSAGRGVIVDPVSYGTIKPKPKIPSNVDAYEATRTLKAYINEHAPEDTALAEMLQKTALLVVLAAEEN